LLDQIASLTLRYFPGDLHDQIMDARRLEFGFDSFFNILLSFLKLLLVNRSHLVT
jgi:hypothetical protein